MSVTEWVADTTADRWKAPDGRTRAFGVLMNTLTVDDVVRSMFGEPYRTDGATKDGVTVGAEPWGAHDALPHNGNTSWDWYHGARFGENPPWDNYVIPWGQCFADINGAGTYDVRLQIKDVTLIYVDSADEWQHVLPSAGPDIEPTGGYFQTAPFAGTSTGDTPEWRWEGDGEGWSGTLRHMEGEGTNGNACVHWFYGNDFYPRPPVPAGAKAILSACQMRLITDVAGDPGTARFIASFGSDHWPAGTGGLPDGTQITPFYQPRMSYVTSDWQWFFGFTFADWFSGPSPVVANMNDSQIRANPPPMVGTSVGTTWGVR